MAQTTTLLTGLALGESPRWHQGRVWFADWGASELIAVTPDGSHEVVEEIASFPFCLDFTPDGRLLVVSAAANALLVRAGPGSLQTYADVSSLSTRPWNDITVDPAGRAYVNNIGFDFGTEEPGPGFVAVVRPDGSAEVVAEDLAFPNGMLVTADGSTLVVAESYAARLTAFDIAADGTLHNRRVWADLGADAAPDGICLDAEGAIWFAEVPGRRCVRVREGGEVLQQIDLELSCFACVLGGPDGRTLFVTAAAWPEAMDPTGPRTGQLLAVPVDVPGPG